MNIIVEKEIDGKQYNKYGELIIICKQCSKNKTTMTGTCLCDSCWEENKKEQTLIYKDLKTKN